MRGDTDMSKSIIYNCDKCGKELSIEERFKFNSSIHLGYKDMPVKKFDLCDKCAFELFKSIGMEEQEIIETGYFDLSKINSEEE